jgi:hypothetical protein
VLSFEALVPVRDPDGRREPPQTFARRLSNHFRQALAQTTGGLAPSAPAAGAATGPAPTEEGEGEVDALETYYARIVAAFQQNEKTLLNEIRTNGVPWRGVQNAILKYVPDVITDRDDFAYNAVRVVMSRIFGEGRWDTERRPNRSDPQQYRTWIVAR